MSDRATLLIMVICMLTVIIGFMFFLPIWVNIVFYAILGWMWAGRKVRKNEEQEEINKQEGIEK